MRRTLRVICTTFRYFEAPLNDINRNRCAYAHFGQMIVMAKVHFYQITPNLDRRLAKCAQLALIGATWLFH